MLITKTASCDVLHNWAVQKGIWHPYTDKAQPGDVVIFDFQGNHKRNQHTGIVQSVSGTSLTTIEGNTSVSSNDNGGAVMRRTRSTSQVTGYIRAKWTSTQTAAEFIAIAAGQIGVTEYPSGSNKVKYNTWYYGSAVSGAAYPWCAVFVVWCFAVLAGDISGETVPKTNTSTSGGTCIVTLKVLRYGMSGSAVKKLQILLNGLGYNCGTVDGKFGSKTSRAVSDFQKDYGLSVDGIVGSATWGALIG